MHTLPQKTEVWANLTEHSVKQPPLHPLEPKLLRFFFNLLDDTYVHDLPIFDRVLIGWDWGSMAVQLNTLVFAEALPEHLQAWRRLLTPPPLVGNSDKTRCQRSKSKAKNSPKPVKWKKINFFDP